MDVTEESLYKGIEAAVPGNHIGDIGFSIQESVKMTSTNAADYLGKKDIGRISKGLKANLILLDNL